MWRYMNDVKPPTQAQHKDTKNVNSKSKEYEAKRKREFKKTWQAGRPWLQNGENGMVCLWCLEFKDKLDGKKLTKSKQFLEGCTSYKSESVAWHEKSAAHIMASNLHDAKENPESTPATQALSQLNTQYSDKLSILFRNAHAVAKHRKSFRD